MTAEEVFESLLRKYGEAFNWSMIRPDKLYFTEEAYREIKEGHFLYGKSLQAVAKCDSNDDVLFIIEKQEGEQYVIVHLTYSGSENMNFPKYNLFSSLEELKAYLESQYLQEYS